MAPQVVMEQPAWAAAEDAEADSLLPLLEAEMDALVHPPGAPGTRQVSGLPPISSRAAQGFGRARQRCARARHAHLQKQQMPHNTCVCFREYGATLHLPLWTGGRGVAERCHPSTWMASMTA